MDERLRPIGVFDSGVGGISVLGEIARLLPDEDIMYLGDDRNAPYGTKPEQEVLRLSRYEIDRLIAMGCKAIVIACNTVTAVAAQPLRQELSLPIIGMEPALKPASMLSGEGQIIVMATPVTLKQAKFQRLMSLYGHDAIPLPCAGLPEFVERGELLGDKLDQRLFELLSPYRDKPIKAVVLGCTHYPFLSAAIRKQLPTGTPLIDGNLGTARQLRHVLEQRGLLRDDKAHRGEIRFFSSDESEKQVEWMKRLFTIATQADFSSR